MKFKFRLERVLQYWKLQETNMKMELAQSTRRLTLAQEMKRTKEEELLRLLGQIPGQYELGGNWVPYGVSQVSFSLKALNSLEQDIYRVAEEVAQKKSELAKVSMRREALEKLKESKTSEFRILERRREQKHLDESFSQFKRK